MNIKSARKASEFVWGSSVDTQGRLVAASVPGHQAKVYDVCFSRKPNQIIVESCIVKHNGIGHCKGCQTSICFHALAALIHTAEHNKLRLIFCSSRERADLIQRTGGKVVEITSKPSGKSGWIVYRSKK